MLASQSKLLAAISCKRLFDFSSSGTSQGFWFHTRFLENSVKLNFERGAAFLESQSEM